MRTIGVLVMAYGGPGSLDEIGPYLADIRGGRPTSEELLHEITERYRLIGGRSPILELTTAQANGIEQALNADAPDGVRYKTYVGMRHWHPYIGEVVPQKGQTSACFAGFQCASAPHAGQANFSRATASIYFAKNSSSAARVMR